MQDKQMDAKKGISAEQWQNAYNEEVWCCDLNLYYSQLSWLKITGIGELAYTKSSSNSIYSLQSEKSFIPFLYGYFNFIFDKQSNLTGYITTNISGRKKDVTGTLNRTYDAGCGLTYSCMKNRLTLKLGVMRIYGEATDKGSVISFLVGNIHHLDMGTLLDRLGIAVRTGHHCAQPLMIRLGVEGLVRASFGLYNTKEEVDTLIAGIQRVSKMFN